MREMLDEFVEKPKEDSGEDRLEMALMSRKDKRKAKRQRFKENTDGMNFSQKLSYIAYSYGSTILTTLFILVCVSILGITLYRNSRPVSIAYAVANLENSDTFNKDIFESYVKETGIKKGHQIISDTLVTLDPKVYQNGEASVTVLESYTDFAMLCENGNYDILITNKNGAKCAAALDRMNPLDTYLPEDVYNKYKDKMLKLSDSAGNVDIYAIDISDTSFGKALNTGFSSIYILCPGVKDTNLENTVRLLNYIYDYK